MNDAAEPKAPNALSTEQRCALMSELADGQPAALQAGCALWREDASAREAWHVYHLIGDVLRADDLAANAQHDLRFLAGVRARLAQEPVVLAPQPLVVAPSSAASSGPASAARRFWLAPAAVAAGFMAVAGVLVVARLAAPVPDGSLLAINPTLANGLHYTAASAPMLITAPASPLMVTTPASPLVVQGRLIRSPQLDSYLRAHRDVLGGVPAAVPGGLPRSIETLAPITPVSATVAR